MSGFSLPGASFSYSARKKSLIYTQANERGKAYATMSKVIMSNGGFTVA